MLLPDLLDDFVGLLLDVLVEGSKGQCTSLCHTAQDGSPATLLRLAVGLLGVSFPLPFGSGLLEIASFRPAGKTEKAVAPTLCNTVLTSWTSVLSSVFKCWDAHLVD